MVRPHMFDSKGQFLLHCVQNVLMWPTCTCFRGNCNLLLTHSDEHGKDQKWNIGFQISTTYEQWTSWPHHKDPKHDEGESEPRSPLCRRPGLLAPSHEPSSFPRPVQDRDNDGDDADNEGNDGDNNVATLRMCISFGGFLLEILAIEGSGDEDVAAAAGGFWAHWNWKALNAACVTFSTHIWWRVFSANWLRTSIWLWRRWSETKK